MISDKPYILFCAGEDSGDSLGESLVLASRKILVDNFLLVGSGGPKMESAGLVPLIKFDSLTVSGFGDVLPRYFSLRKKFNVLKKALENPQCKALVAVDYPGFNLKLVEIANKLHKPVLYVAPPQAWAWKPLRARKLSNPENTLALFFDFEETPYKTAGCNILRMEHPLVSAIKKIVGEETSEKKRKERILLLPGSRKSQMLRNLPLFLELVKVFPESQQIEIVVPRMELQKKIEAYLRRIDHSRVFDEKYCNRLRVRLAPRDACERLLFFGDSSLALSTPGTATLELALAGCTTVTCTRPDFLTYALGKHIVKTPWFSLPNLILKKEIFPEFILRDSDPEQIVRIQNKLLESSRSSLSKLDVEMLRKTLQVGIQVNLLMSKFFAQFLKS